MNFLFNPKLYILASILAVCGHAQADVVFQNCSDENLLTAVSSGLKGFAFSNGIDYVHISESKVDRGVKYSLKGMSTNTLTLKNSPILNVGPEYVRIKENSIKEIVSKGEIIAALLSPGRTTTFSCNIESFTDHVGLRQNIVRWANGLEFDWPDGTPARWGVKKLWKDGTPTARNTVLSSYEDVFKNSKNYAVGCYTATKLVYGWATLDYYSRVKPNVEKYNKVINELYRDADPLVSTEPHYFWKFEPDFDGDLTDGKLLTMAEKVDPLNIIPGDWVYFLNPDPSTYARAGYEGSNTIYLGLNRFTDYYADTPGGFYSIEQKIDEVYQWKNGVFSRSRHNLKIEPMSSEKLITYTQPPSQGGFLIENRLVPKIW